MKVWLMSLLVFLLFITLGITSTRYLHHSSARVIRQANRVEQRIARHHWPEATRSFKEIQQSWEKIRPWWAILIHHQEIDNIDNALVRLEQSIRCRNSDDSLMSSGELTYFLQHIPEREKFTLVNIL